MVTFVDGFKYKWANMLCLIGLSDPFCTLFVTSKESSKRTKVVEKSLNPQWNETFKL